MKKFVIGVVVGAFLATAGTAAASTIIEKVTASVRTDYSVEVDGNKIALENAPLAYKGSAYIAVREISNVIGKDVGFEDGVIKISTPVETLEDILTRISSLKSMKQTYLHNIEFVKDGIRRADEGQFKPSDEEYQGFKDSLAYYEVELAKIETEITELEKKKAELEAQQ